MGFEVYEHSPTSDFLILQSLYEVRASHWISFGQPEHSSCLSLLLFSLTSFPLTLHPFMTMPVTKLPYFLLFFFQPPFVSNFLYSLQVLHVPVSIPLRYPFKPFARKFFAFSTAFYSLLPAAPSYTAERVSTTS